MSNVRVMVVDDSAAMRALFCDILDQAKGVDVVGTARNADEARDKLEELKPDVLTLDVEMPGMTGMEFLEEIMAENPLPVIMLSSITQAGTGTAEKALQLGAVHCFPKPQHTTPEEFNATVNKLGGIVIQAANGELSGGGSETGGYQSDGRIVALTGDAGGISAMREIVAAYPAACPPTLIVLDADEAAVENAVATMRPSVACQIEDAIDGAMMTPGTVYLAYNPAVHVLLEAGPSPIIRLADRDPVAGVRPSADLLFGSMARAGIPAVGGVLAGKGTDGAKGVQMLSAAKASVFVHKPHDYEPGERYDAVRGLGIEVEALPQNGIADWILAQTSAEEQAAA